MKLFISLVLVLFVAPFTIGASIIDKDTKKMVEELNYKIERLLQYGHANHSEQMRAAKEQNELLQRLTTRVETLERREHAVTTTPAAATTPTPLPPVEAVPATTTPTVTVKPTPVESVKAPVETAQKPQVPATAPVPPKRPEPAKKPSPSSFDGVLPYLISVLSVLLMIILFVRMKRSEQRIKTMLWRADMEALREDLARERKMNPLNTKVHLTGEPNKVHLP